MKRTKHRINACILCLALVLCGYTSANAHFVWVYSEGGKVKVVFGEGLEPDQAQFLSGLDGMKSYTIRQGQYEAVEFEKQVDGDEGWFEASQNTLGQLIEVSCPYGVFGSGEKTMFLDYSAKHLTVDGATELLNFEKPSNNLALDIVPSLVEGNLFLTAYFQGHPLQGVKVQLESVESSVMTRTTDGTGRVSLQTSSRYVIRAKHAVPEAGEIDGKEFTERRYYCTLVLDVGSKSEVPVQSDAALASQEDAERPSTHSGLTIRKVESQLGEFPRGMTSFGATVLDNSIYVVGGKSGKAHSYAKSYQNRNVYCLKLDGSDNQWHVAGENLGLQGLAIVGHAGKIYRIGGLEARNQEGDEHDLHSVNDFMAFDPIEKKWTELPELPEGRSSFDACVVGNHAYVVGGWKMTGKEETVWATEMLKFDLSNSDSKWQRVEAPFKTRALAVLSHQGRIVAVGGIQAAGGPTNAVHIYDLKTGKWSKGPAIPTEGKMKAFGCSAVSLGEQLLVSTYDGGIFQLNKEATKWNKVHQLDAGRFFHQMLPIGKTKFALVGGSHMEHGSQMEVEVFEIAEEEPAQVSKR